MKINELPHLKRALDLMGLDIGANVHGEAIIPPEWETPCRIADTELAMLADEQVETLAQGEETDQKKIAKIAPNADHVFDAAFDNGPLADRFFAPWQNIYDARAAEERVHKSIGTPAADRAKGE